MYQFEVLGNPEVEAVDKDIGSLLVETPEKVLIPHGDNKVLIVSRDVRVVGWWDIRFEFNKLGPVLAHALEDYDPMRTLRTHRRYTIPVEIYGDDYTAAATASVAKIELNMPNEYVEGFEIRFKRICNIDVNKIKKIHGESRTTYIVYLIRAPERLFSLLGARF
ncbi:MAG: hypothetical protein ACK4SY_10180 [Pyrobaculum sp.]